MSLVPAMSALAAGNCVVLRLSQKVPHTMEVVSRIISHFPQELIMLVSGDHSVTDFLLDCPFDKIFFTGSPAIGSKIMKKAAENLIPVTLELGGKNPCVVAADARLELAARRIVSGKFINGGQTCIAPDYLLVDQKVKERFMKLLVSEIRSFYGDNPALSSDYCRMISSGQAARIESFLQGSEIVYGGVVDRENCYVSPTIISGITPDDQVMQEEIFGPLLPVITFTGFDEACSIINRNPKSLAAYIFTTSKSLAGRFMSCTQSGSVAVNDTVMQVASPHLPFGGIGPSGMGRYHGRKSFETFSNMRSVMAKSNLIDLPARYPPYTPLREKIVRLIMR